MSLNYYECNFQGKPNGRITKELDKNPLVERKIKYLLIDLKKYGTMRISWKIELILFGERMLF